MPLLYALLISVAEKVLSFAFKKMLVGAGIGLASFGLSQLAFSMMLDYVNARFNFLSSIFFLIDLSGIDEALSFIISAVSITLATNAGKLALRKM